MYKFEYVHYGVVYMYGIYIYMCMYVRVSVSVCVSVNHENCKTLFNECDKEQK